MNTRRISLLMVLLLLMAAVLLVGGCCKDCGECEGSRHYVDVYINEICDPVTLENDEDIDPLWVFKGDHVIFNNMRETETVTLELPPGMFELDTVEIKAKHRVILEVVDGGEESGKLKVRGTGCPVGDPDVKIGEGP